ncbi:hypothetical protein BpHYR1_040037 [Brachionus plicatilis]|uniref:Uncharacterized protein n=1 Tax=Brachionus plicatilis TaxID=10195 RepID=A0A3M7R4W7_BRAPC|nr:hypothetical protein BpHYR1_040037 [Brachionus plicatilis]
MQHHSQDPGYSASPQPEIRFWRMQHNIAPAPMMWVGKYLGCGAALSNKGIRDVNKDKELKIKIEDGL